MKITLLVGSICIFQISFAQTITNLSDADKTTAYVQAVTQYINTYKKDIHKTDTLFLEENSTTTNSLPAIYRSTRLISLSKEQVKQLLNKRHSLNLYRMEQVKCEDGIFSVTLTPLGCGFNKARNKYEYLYGGGYTAIFTFDGKKLVFQKIEEHGI